MSKITKLGKKTIVGSIFALTIIGLCQTKLTFTVLLIIMIIGSVWEISTAYDQLALPDFYQFVSIAKTALLFGGMIISFYEISRRLPLPYCLVLIGTYCLVDVSANLWGNCWVHHCQKKTLKKYHRLNQKVFILYPEAPEIHYLAPTISPHKTWAGAWAGLLAGTVGFPFLIWLMQQIYPSTMTVAHVLIPTQPLASVQTYNLGLTLAWLAILGDLNFSKTKRIIGIKDFSIRWRKREIHLLCSHGGMLDRIDSWSITTIFMAIWLTLSRFGFDTSLFALLLPYPVMISIWFYARS